MTANAIKWAAGESSGPPAIIKPSKEESSVTNHPSGEPESVNVRETFTPVLAMESAPRAAKTLDSELATAEVPGKGSLADPTAPNPRDSTASPDAIRAPRVTCQGWVQTAIGVACKAGGAGTTSMNVAKAAIESKMRLIVPSCAE